MYLTDYHTHTKLSPDGSVPLAEMAQAAVDAGLDELCVTDHCDLLGLYGEPEDHYDWPPALEQYAAAVPRYADRLTIRLGLEFGMAHLNPELSRAILNRPELDFVLGSIHNLCPEKGGTDFYYVDYPDPAACYAALDDYFASMAKLAATDPCATWTTPSPWTATATCWRASSARRRSGAGALRSTPGGAAP